MDQGIVFSCFLAKVERRWRGTRTGNAKESLPCTSPISRTAYKQRHGNVSFVLPSLFRSFTRVCCAFSSLQLRRSGSNRKSSVNSGVSRTIDDFWVAEEKTGKRFLLAPTMLLSFFSSFFLGRGTQFYFQIKYREYFYYFIIFFSFIEDLFNFIKFYFSIVDSAGYIFFFWRI